MAERTGRWGMLIERLPAGRPLLGAEIGVWRGDMASRVLRAMPHLRLLLVDRWAPPEAGDSYHRGKTRISQMPASEFAAARRRCAELMEPFRDRVFWLAGHSVAMADKVGDATLDYAFIDADHSYEGCLADIRAWAPKVKPGGLIGGHDYGRPDQGDVAGAVHAYFAPAPGRAMAREVEISDHHCWWVRL